MDTPHDAQPEPSPTDLTALAHEVPGIDVVEGELMPRPASAPATPPE